MIEVDADAATPTQSPTAGKSAAEDDSWRKRPLTSAQPRGAAVDAVQPALLLDDARPRQARADLVAFVLLNLLFEETVPAPTFE